MYERDSRTELTRYGVVKRRIAYVTCHASYMTG
jgi:hypothetical protein